MEGRESKLEAWKRVLEEKPMIQPKTIVVSKGFDGRNCKMANTKLVLVFSTGERLDVGEYSTMDKGFCLICQEPRESGNLQAHIVCNHLDLQEHKDCRFEEIRR